MPPRSWVGSLTLDHAMRGSALGKRSFLAARRRTFGNRARVAHRSGSLAADLGHALPFNFTAKMILRATRRSNPQRRTVDPSSSRGLESPDNVMMPKV